MRRLWLLGLLLLACWPLRAAASPLGAVQSVEKRPDGVRLRMSGGDIVDVHVKAADVVRVRVVRSEAALEPDHSWALAEHVWPSVSFTVDPGASPLVLKTDRLQIRIARTPLLISFLDPQGHVLNADDQPMDVSDHAVMVYKSLGLYEHFYGLGEKTANLDKRHESYTMWTTDQGGGKWGLDPLYQSIPFYLGWQDHRAYGLYFDNSYRSVFDMGASQNRAVQYSAEDGDIDYYFLYGPSIPHVLGLYADLTGHVPMPPRWALGNQQSRYSYYPDTMAEAIVQRYRADRLPLDVLHLDIHFMNGYRIFTWDPRWFPDPGRFLSDLLKEGVHVVTIVDPGVKLQPATGPVVPSAHPELGSQQSSYYVYQQGLAGDYFLKRSDGNLWIGEVWPGQAVFVDYTLEAARKWWGDLHRAYLDYGVAGIWNDMNEPSDFVDQTGKSQQNVVFDDLGRKSPYNQFRQLFALLEARATFEGMARLRPRQRPFVITRSGFAGIQRYATMWTGDNESTWESLSLCLPEFMGLGLSGETFVGADIGGFNGRCSGELLTRWYQVGFLTPLCRNHHVIDGYDQEPWRFGTSYENIIRRYLDLRYRLLPYLYTVLEDAHRIGVPWFRPLVLEFPDDDNTVNLDDEVMIGPSLLLAPVTTAGARQRDVYLPSGLWYDFWTRRAVQGGRMLTVAAPLDKVPLFVRGGSVVPMGPVMQYVGQKPVDPLEFDIYPDASGTASGTLYEDDGTSPDYQNGVCARSTVVVHGTRVEWSGPQGSFKPGARTLLFRRGVQSATLHDDGRPHTVQLLPAR